MINLIKKKYDQRKQFLCILWVFFSVRKIDTKHESPHEEIQLILTEAFGKCSRIIVSFSILFNVIPFLRMIIAESIQQMRKDAALRIVYH